MRKINNIVLIDDNKVDGFVNQKIISLVNSNVITKLFNSSVSAFEYFNTNPKDSKTHPVMLTDLILLDINMPVMNGFEFLNKLSKIKPFLRNPFDVYFLSSSDNEEDITEALNIKFCSGYLVKPLTKEKIKDLLISKKLNINS
ncbi:MAG: response regulator [Flavobacteriaceae bacterium]|nr:response regulator [Flavobacteriaceae bacterium]